MKEFLELEARQKIYEIIRKNPGINLSKIANILKMRISHVEYHLRYMKKHEIINSSKYTGYARFYTNNQENIGSYDKKILSIIRQKTPLKIVLLLLKNVYMRHKEILKEINLAPSTLSYHINKLKKLGLIEICRIKDENNYALSNRKKIVNLIVRYKPYNLFESFKDVWKDLKIE